MFFKSMFKEETIPLLDQAITESPFCSLLLRNAKEIGFKFADETIIASLNKTESSISLRVPNSIDDTQPELWVEFNKKDLVNLIKKRKPVSGMTISTSKKGQVLHPKVERIIQRIFMPQADNSFQIMDTIDLVYGSIFGFIEPRVAWRSTKSELYVLRYPQVYNGLDIYVSIGFTNPGYGTPAIKIDDSKVSGFGYELMVFSSPDNDIMGRQLIGWVRYLENTHNHIVQGQYLEYQEGIIPDTDFSGLLVLNPIDFSEKFPVSNGFGIFNMLVGVTKNELEIAKAQDNYVVAEALFKNGYVNYTPIKRSSVL